MVKDGIFLGKRYEVLSKIGAGGMADVYKGKDTKLNRFVAIKVLKKEYREACAQGSPASACIACRQCEGACPQHLEVVAQLQRVAKVFEA